jgi:hypothetical protein
MHHNRRIVARQRSRAPLTGRTAATVSLRKLPIITFAHGASVGSVVDGALSANMRDTTSAWHSAASAARGRSAVDDDDRPDYRRLTSAAIDMSIATAAADATSTAYSFMRTVTPLLPYA